MPTVIGHLHLVLVAWKMIAFGAEISVEYDPKYKMTGDLTECKCRTMKWSKFVELGAV